MTYGRIYSASTLADLTTAVAKANRAHAAQRALDKMEIAIRHVRRLGYHSIADNIAAERETLRTLTKAETS
jgi:hypothetical protein